MRQQQTDGEPNEPSGAVGTSLPWREPRVSFDVEVLAFPGERMIHCKGIDISASGMLLHGADPYPKGSHFDFVFALPGNARVVEGTAEIVRYAVSGNEGLEGFGARFVSLRDDGKARLEKFIASQLKAR